MARVGKDEADKLNEVQAACEVMDRHVRGLSGMHATVCMRCGLCGESCHVYLGDPEYRNLPAAKVAEVASAVRRRYTVLGKLLPWLVDAKEFTPQILDGLPEAVYGRCTGCGRCAVHCPVGVDLKEVVRLGRKICAATGRVPEELGNTVDAQLETGNQMSISKEELASTAEWLSEDLAMEMADEAAKVHLDKKGARILYLVNPREIKFFPLSLMAAAGVFHAAGESWTMASGACDVTNYGYFAGDDEAAAELTRRVMAEAKELGVEEVVLSECGHGYRSFRWEGPRWLGKDYDVPVRSVLELVDEYLEQGRIKVDPSKNSERVTLHDPCNLVRLGGLVEPQRKILRRVVSEFVEMAPNGRENYCCGGGGGMLAMSAHAARRIASGRPKADQIKATEAKIVASPCHNCADQLIELSKSYKLGVEIQSVVELTYNALCHGES